MEYGKQHVDRMRRHDQEQHHVGEQEELLDRVHGETRQRADVDVAVMPGVHLAVDGAAVEQPVLDREVERRHSGTIRYQRDEPHRIRRPGDDRGPAVGVGPPHEGLPDRPADHGGAEGEHGVVPNLVVEQEDVFVATEGASVVAQIVTRRRTCRGTGGSRRWRRPPPPDCEATTVRSNPARVAAVSSDGLAHRHSTNASASMSTRVWANRHPRSQKRSTAPGSIGRWKSGQERSGTGGV